MYLVQFLNIFLVKAVPDLKAYSFILLEGQKSDSDLHA